MTFTHKKREYSFVRYPETTNKSLRAWSAADEYILIKLEELGVSSKTVAIYNDRFGFLSNTLNEYDPEVVVDHKSQQKAIEQNLKLNELSRKKSEWVYPLEELPEPADIGIISIPKTMDLFKFYLHQLSRSLKDDGVVLCSFMTKYFSPQMLSIAEEYFEEVEQSMARKKARVLVLKNKKPLPESTLMNTISYAFGEREPEDLKQYYGVFSSGNVDFATQFLIENLNIKDEDQMVLDLASGNGVIARAMQLQKADLEIHLVDDSLLAVESSMLNMENEKAHFHWDDTLQSFEENTFDLVVSNPPFHFEHETNIEVTTRLFVEVKKVLKPGGRFICVANQHLNYKTHLAKIFEKGEIMAKSDKYILYKSTKA